MPRTYVNLGVLPKKIALTCGFPGWYGAPTKSGLAVLGLWLDRQPVEYVSLDVDSDGD